MMTDDRGARGMKKDRVIRDKREKIGDASRDKEEGTIQSRDNGYFVCV